MTAEELCTIMDYGGWSSEWLADVLTMNGDRLVRRWQTGARGIPDDVAAWIEELSALMKEPPNVAGWDGLRLRNVMWRWLDGKYVDVVPEVGAWLEAIGAVLDCAPKVAGRPMERGDYVQQERGDG